jgi:hypothetical protein
MNLAESVANDTSCFPDAPEVAPQNQPDCKGKEDAFSMVLQSDVAPILSSAAI